MKRLLAAPLLFSLVILSCPIDDWRDNRSSVTAGQVVPIPAPTPAPAPEITVIATPRVELGHWVKIKITTTGTLPRVRVRQVLPGEDLYLPADDGSGESNSGVLSLGNGVYVLTWSQGEFAIEADAQTPLGTITAVTRSVIGEPPPPGPPPIVKTLADLAGDKAPALALSYSQLLEAIGDFTDVDHFRRTEVALIAKRGLTGHGATAEIAKRLNVKTLAELQAALERVVAELGSPSPPPVSPDKTTAATYVYEKDDGGVPPPVGAALGELNAAGLRATTFEEDTTDGSGSVPDQYVVPLKAAREAGLPSLVVTAGQRVKRVVKAPTTKEQVLEAAK